VDVVVFDHGCFPQPQEREVGLPIKGVGHDEAIPFEPSFGFALLLLLSVFGSRILVFQDFMSGRTILILQCGFGTFTSPYMDVLLFNRQEGLDL
jgi:hypothetical protein